MYQKRAEQSEIGAYVLKVSAFVLNKLPKFPDVFFFTMCEVTACSVSEVENFKTSRFGVKIEHREVSLLHDRGCVLAGRNEILSLLVNFSKLSTDLFIGDFKVFTHPRFSTEVITAFSILWLISTALPPLNCLGFLL